MEQKTLKTAVVVDDELITRMDFSQMLTDMGYLVVGEASDGFDAVEVCEKQRPDFVLMDISMPIFNGLSATEKILSDNLSTSVIILSAFSDTDTVKKAASLGVRAYLVKPVDRNMLYAALETALAAAERETVLLHEKEQAISALEDMKMIDKAKRFLSLRESIPESEAYRRIQKLSMDKRCSMAKIASSILETDESQKTLKKAKDHLMLSGLSEKDAYQKVLSLAEENGISELEAAELILS